VTKLNHGPVDKWIDENEIIAEVCLSPEETEWKLVRRELDFMDVALFSSICESLHHSLARKRRESLPIVRSNERPTEDWHLCIYAKNSKCHRLTRMLITDQLKGFPYSRITLLTMTIQVIAEIAPLDVPKFVTFVLLIFCFNNYIKNYECTKLPIDRCSAWPLPKSCKIRESSPKTKPTLNGTLE
jgi:hypothetical protein